MDQVKTVAGWGTSRIGVIGCGARISHVIRNVRRFAPGVTVTAVYDPNLASISRFGEELERLSPSVCDSAEDLCQRDDVDWVFIGSWNCFHAGQAITALKNGKHVFCEKPVALTLDEALAMHEAWTASGRQFALGLVLRYSPLYRLVRRMIDEGKLGQLLSFEFNETLAFNHGGYIHGNWRRFSANAGSHLLEKCCHDIDLALWLAGDVPVRVASFGGNTFFVPGNIGRQNEVDKGPKGETAFQAWRDADGINPFTAEKDIVDHQVGILEFGSGIRATFHTHCMSGLPERRFYLIGSKGAIRLDAYTGKVEYAEVGWDKPVCVHTPIAGDGHAGSDEPMARELAVCMAEGSRPAAGLIEGMKSLVVVEAMDRSMRGGGVVDLSESWAKLARVAFPTAA